MAEGIRACEGVEGGRRVVACETQGFCKAVGRLKTTIEPEALADNTDIIG